MHVVLILLPRSYPKTQLLVIAPSFSVDMILAECHMHFSGAIQPIKTGKFLISSLWMHYSLLRLSRALPSSGVLLEHTEMTPTVLTSNVYCFRKLKRLRPFYSNALIWISPVSNFPTHIRTPLEFSRGVLPPYVPTGVHAVSVHQRAALSTGAAARRRLANGAGRPPDVGKRAKPSELEHVRTKCVEYFSFVLSCGFETTNRLKAPPRVGCRCSPSHNF